MNIITNKHKRETARRIKLMIKKYNYNIVLLFDNYHHEYIVVEEKDVKEILQTFDTISVIEHLPSSTFGKTYL